MRLVNGKNRMGAYVGKSRFFVLTASSYAQLEPQVDQSIYESLNDGCRAHQQAVHFARRASAYGVSVDVGGDRVCDDAHEYGAKLRERSKFENGWGRFCDAAQADQSAGKSGNGPPTIMGGLESSSDFYNLAQAAGLKDALSGPGSFTVFVPLDSAFAKATGESVQRLMMPPNKDRLTDLLSYHILPGTLQIDDIRLAIQRKGKATLSTMNGGTMVATEEGATIVLTGSSGRKARIVRGDLQRSNGLVHEIDEVLQPPTR